MRLLSLAGAIYMRVSQDTEGLENLYKALFKFKAMIYLAHCS